MTLISKKQVMLVIAIVTAFVVVFAFATTVSPPTPESTPAATNKVTANNAAMNKVSTFLSDVAGLDLVNYTLVDCTPIYTEDMLYDFRTNYSVGMSTFGGLMFVENPSYYVQYNENKLNVTCTLYNGTLAHLRMNSQEKPVFSETQENETAQQAQTILERYQTYVRDMYADDGSYVESMLDVLRSVNEPKNTTLGEISLQFFTTDNAATVTWTYNSNGVTVGGKNLALSFKNGTINSFSDTWRLYNSMEKSKLSAKEVYDIALEAAQKVEFTVVGENDVVTTYNVPDLSNASYSMDLYFLKQKASWYIIFYFDELIARFVGVEGIVSGDTGEVSNFHAKRLR